ncbi:MAG: hypothetical protein RBR74_07135 [Ignavibacteriaceae bacterium]|jgi:hypothetical protein|nr:hypothetical protein [Ignavibacteriaceae bacterium]
MTIPDKISAYLNKRASDKWKIENDHPKFFQKIIVVPSIAESDNLGALIKSLKKNDKLELHNTLLLIVVNNAVSSSDEVKEDNKKTLKYLRKLKPKLYLSFIDACSPGKEMDDKDAGVGLSRKIGMDLALTKFDYLSLNKNIMICTDADCIVDPNYLNEISDDFNRNNYEAATVNFAHDISGNDEETKAIICYEIFLRYYVSGLSFAKSEYAFHTIGSTMICTPEAYVKIEGMNKYKAAEDFYFLEKLAKVYPVGEIKTTFVHPSKRASWRVPFGTGRSVDRYLSNKRNEYQLYDPESFIILKNWLEIYFDQSLLDQKSLIKISRNIHPALYLFLNEQGFEKFIHNVLLNNKNAIEIDKQKHYWFDAFKTLKLIHYLRDIVYPNLNMFDAIDKLLKLMNIESKISRNSAIPDLKIQKEYLLMLRKIQS